MSTATKLNENEILVLKSCKDSIYNYSRVEFGPTSNVKPEGLTGNSVKGYLSQLSQKGLIEMWGNDNNNNLSLTLVGCDYLLSITTDESEIQIINQIKANL